MILFYKENKNIKNINKSKKDEFIKRYPMIFKDKYMLSEEDSKRPTTHDI